MSQSKNSSSLFLYTALIFLVALMMIILSFFGSGKHESAKEEAKTLTERATAVSEENLNLTKKVNELEGTVKENEKTITEYEESVKIKDETIQTLTNESSIYKNLIIAYERIDEGKTKEASDILAVIDATILSEDTLTFYNKLINLTNKGE